MSTLFANKYYQQLFENGSDASTLQDHDLSTEGTDMRLQRIFGGRQEEEDSVVTDFTETTEDRLERIFGGADEDEEDDEDEDDDEDDDSDSSSTMVMGGGGGRLVKGSQAAKDRMAAIRAMRKRKSAAVSSDATSTMASTVSADSEAMVADFMRRSAKNSVEVAQKALNFVKGLQPDYPNKARNVKKAQNVLDAEKQKYNTMIQQETNEIIFKQQKSAKKAHEKEIENTYAAAKVAYDVLKNSSSASTIDKEMAKKRLALAKEQYNEYHYLKSTERNVDAYLNTYEGNQQLPLRQKNAEKLVGQMEKYNEAKKVFQKHLNDIKAAQATLDYLMALPVDHYHYEITAEDQKDKIKTSEQKKEMAVKEAIDNLEAAQTRYNAFLEKHDVDAKKSELQRVIDDAELYDNYIAERSNYAGKASNKYTAEKNLETARKALNTYKQSLTEKQQLLEESKTNKEIQAAEKELNNAILNFQRSPENETKNAALTKLQAAWEKTKELKAAANAKAKAKANAAKAKANAALAAAKPNAAKKAKNTPVNGAKPNSTNGKTIFQRTKNIGSAGVSALGTAGGVAGSMLETAGGVAGSMLETAGGLAATLATGAAAGASSLATGIRGMLSRPSRKQNSPSLPRGQNSQPSPTNSAQFEFDKLLEKAYQEMQVDQQINPNTMEQLEAAFAKVEKNDNNKELFNHFKKQFYGDENDEGDDESGDDTTEADPEAAPPAAAAPASAGGYPKMFTEFVNPKTGDKFTTASEFKEFLKGNISEMIDFFKINHLQLPLINKKNKKQYKVSQYVKGNTAAKNGVALAITGNKWG